MVDENLGKKLSGSDWLMMIALFKAVACFMKRKLQKNAQLCGKRGGGALRRGRPKYILLRGLTLWTPNVFLTHCKRNDAGEEGEERKEGG